MPNANSPRDATEMNVSIGDSTWQMWAFVACGVWIAWSAYRGWEEGGLRQFIFLLAVASGGLIGWHLSPSLLPLLRASLPWPDILLRGILTAGIGLTIIFGATLIARIFLKKTKHQSQFLLKMGFGISGAALGLLIGILGVAVILSGIRLAASLAEAQFALKNSKRADTELPEWQQSLVRLQKSLELGPVGEAVKAVDPIPREVKQTTALLSQLLSNPEAMVRFLRVPSVRAVAEHPKIQGMLHDESIQKLALGMDIGALLAHPEFVSALNDPEVAEKLAAVDLDAAITASLVVPSDTEPGSL